MPISEVFNMDCMDGMKNYPDKYFDLAVVDPPYGIEKQISIGGGSNTKSQVKFHQLYSENHKKWDVAPNEEYFIKLFRISKNQIIWGGNYFSLGRTRGFIVWDKKQPMPNFSRCEFAWTSFDSVARIADIPFFGNAKRDVTEKIHPTQKPVALYDWIYKNYLPQGGKVLDTHLGSGSNRIAADKAGNIDFTGYELDKDYFEAQEKRWKEYRAQMKLFV
jgi:site-specific DNA-methyltransferase (adenine-specific)